MTLLALIFKSSMYIIKIVKNKNCGSFYIFLIYFNFFFNFPFLSIKFQKQNFVTNSKHICWLLIKTYQKVVQKVTDIVGNTSLLGFFDSFTEDNLTDFYKIQNFSCIQICGRPNFKKPGRKHTFMISTQKGGGEGGS